MSFKFQNNITIINCHRDFENKHYVCDVSIKNKQLLIKLFDLPFDERIDIFFDASIFKCTAYFNKNYVFEKMQLQTETEGGNKVNSYNAHLSKAQEIELTEMFKAKHCKRKNVA